MAKTRDDIINEVIGIEGGYVDHPNDPGGRTNYGITEAVARAHGYDGSMDELTAPMARYIYQKGYWDKLRLDDVHALDVNVAYEVFDTAVNMGIGTAGKLLQRALNALNNAEKLYKDIAVDGAVGPATIAALKAYLDIPKGYIRPNLIKALNCLQGARYIEIVEKREASEVFLAGWLAQRVKL